MSASTRDDEDEDHRISGPPAAGDPDPPRRAPRRRIVLAWTWVVLWAGVIWMLGGDDYALNETSRLLSPWLEWLIGDIDVRTRYRILVALRKSAHFVEYAILALLTFRAALMAAPRNQLATAAWTALFLVAALATADEARQAFSPARTGSPWDVLIDLTGGCLTVLGLILISRRMRAATPPHRHGRVSA